MAKPQKYYLSLNPPPEVWRVTEEEYHQYLKSGKTSHLVSPPRESKQLCAVKAAEKKDIRKAQKNGTIYITWSVVADD